jgi:predicted nucleic acid-binding protein
LKDNQKSTDENIYTEILNSSKIHGGAVRDIAMGLLQLGRFDSLITARAIVLDTNIILKDLGQICKKKKPTTLYTEAEFGFFKLLVTPSIIDEVEEHIPKYARNTKNNVQDMIHTWEIYKQKLVVINPTPKVTIQNKKLLERDPDDAPTAYLIEMIQPYLSLSADKDLIDYGFAQKGDWLPYVLKSSNLVKRDVGQIIFSVGTLVVVFGLSKNISLIVKLLFRVIQNIPKQIVSLFGIVLLSIILDKKTRNWIVKKIKKMMLNINSPTLFSNIKNTLVALSENYKVWFEDEKFVKQGNVNNPTVPSSLIGYTIRILAHTAVPLSSYEILLRVKKIGYQPRGQNPEPYLLSLLKKNSIFIQDQEGKWELYKGIKNSSEVLGGLHES